MDFNQTNQDIAVIYDEHTNERLAKAPIIKFDKARQIITMDAKYFDSDESARVTLLLLSKDEIWKCQGMLRKYVNLGYREIAIFNAKENEGRTATRYHIDLNATIQNIHLANTNTTVTDILPVTLQNISRSGASLTTSYLKLTKDSTFQLKLKIGENNVLINTIVVRQISAQLNSVTLGCSFLSIAD